ncbi:MAG: hypothetical protein KCHDKBKB_01350 [Elusimicrobia bacterium]|nr:hypothetical protein [Elusimicrobiota bacterium]
MKIFIRNRIRDGIFGLQDGLISTSGALLGIAVGTQNSSVAALSGLVIVTVESLSMAAGSYISSKSQREYLERLLKEEKEAIENDPEGERQELRTMYRERGFTDQEIAMLENRLFSDKNILLEDMAHKELGICPRSMEDPIGNALIMGLAYIIGGMIPVGPYFWWPVQKAIVLSIFLTASGLFVFGGVKGKLVHQVWWKSGLEMMGVAGIAGIAGYVIGSLAKRWV